MTWKYLADKENYIKGLKYLTRLTKNNVFCDSLTNDQTAQGMWYTMTMPCMDSKYTIRNVDTYNANSWINHRTELKISLSGWKRTTHFTKYEQENLYENSTYAQRNLVIIITILHTMKTRLPDWKLDWKWPANPSKSNFYQRIKCI